MMAPTQSIAAIAMRLNYVQMLLKERPDEAPPELARIEELARRTTKEIRHMLFTLRPLILETHGLRAAIEQYIAKRMETDPLPIRLEAPEGVDSRLDKDQQGTIFYIIEEAISNARKHAHASQIWVRMYTRGTSSSPRWWMTEWALTRASWNGVTKSAAVWGC